MSITTVLRALSISILVLAGPPVRPDCPPTRLEVPFSFDLDDPCTGETVAYQGSADLVVRECMEASGRQAFSSRLRVRSALGIGLTSGDAYRLRSSQTAFTETEEDGLPFIQDLHTHVSVLNRLRGSVHRMTMHFRVVVNGEGEVTDFFDRAEQECVAPRE